MADEMMYNSMLLDALMGLENGHLMPCDKQVLSFSPLPDSITDPYTKREVSDVHESMRLTYETMAVWIEESQKTNYFSKRFVQLSRMIMNGVTTMGRGLVTLHARGEDLRDVPMSIRDLIGVASYHFRKSLLGVLQTVRSHPEISERLMMNQIGWNNMLMRLFKTKAKLAEPVSGASVEQGARIKGQVGAMVQGPGDGDRLSAADDQKAMIDGQCDDQALLPSPSGDDFAGELSLQRDATGEPAVANAQMTDAKNAGFDPFKAVGPSVRGLSEPSAIREPGALTAPRAFSSYDPSGNHKSAKTVRGTLENGSSGKKAADQEALSAADQTPEIENQTSEINKTNEETQAEPKENQKEITKTNEKDTAEAGGESSKNEGGDSPMKGESPGENQLPPDAGNGANGDDGGDSPMKGQSPEESPDMPPYLQILQNVFARSGPTEDDQLSFTFDELIYLAADPDFTRIYPDQAAQIRSILQQINSS